MDDKTKRALDEYNRGRSPAISLPFSKPETDEDKMGEDTLKEVRDALSRVAARDELLRMEKELGNNMRALEKLIGGSQDNIRLLGKYVVDSQKTVDQFNFSNTALTSLMENVRTTLSNMNVYLANLQDNADLERRVLLRLYERLK